MRTLISMALFAAFIGIAGAQEANAPAAPDAGQAAEAKKQLTVQLIQKQLEATGLADVHVSPQVHMVQARDKDGKKIVLIVEPETMVAIPLMLPAEPSTTGSGSEDEGEEKL
jgi:hypothetical protein